MASQRTSPVMEGSWQQTLQKIKLLFCAMHTIQKQNGVFFLHKKCLHFKLMFCKTDEHASLGMVVWIQQNVQRGARSAIVEWTLDVNMQMQLKNIIESLFYKVIKFWQVHAKIISKLNIAHWFEYFSYCAHFGTNGLWQEQNKASKATTFTTVQHVPHSFQFFLLLFWNLCQLMYEQLREFQWKFFSFVSNAQLSEENNFMFWTSDQLCVLSLHSEICP